MSADAKTKDRPMIAIGATLMLIGGVSAFLLAFVYSFTSPLIAANKSRKEAAAIRAVFPGAERIEKKSGNVTEVWQAGAVAGWMVKTVSKGYGGDLVLMVGLDASRKVKGIQVLELKETPGLGTKIEEVKKGEKSPWFMAQFLGRDGRNVRLGGEIQAISGATISSRAVHAGVQSAYGLLDAETGGNHAVSGATK